MNDRDETLVRVLARADACQLPVRDWRGHVPANRSVWLQALPRSGLALPCLGRGDVARKRQERSLDALAKSGLATIRTARAEKSPRITLTAAGELRARALANLPGLADALGFVADLAERTLPEPVLFQHLWLAETALAGGVGWGPSSAADRRLQAVVELAFLPAAARGWAACESTVAGHVFYRLTRGGWGLLERFADGQTPPDVRSLLDLELPNSGDAFGGLYRREQDAALAELASAADDGRRERDIGALPLPVAATNVPIADLGFALA